MLPHDNGMVHANNKMGKQRKEKGKAHYLQYLIKEEEKRLVFAVGGRSVQ